MTTNSLQTQIKTLLRQLDILQEQQAKFGPLHTPPYLIIEIEETQAELARLKAELDRAGEEEPPPAPLALPTATIPDPAPLPKPHRLPYRKNPMFVGREADLRHLAHSMQVGTITAVGQVAAATGLGGIGKSQLAIEFAHRYGQYFPGGVFWVSMAEADSVSTEVALCGQEMALRPDLAKLPLPDQVALTRRAWQEEIPRLLIFDNCEEQSLLAEWLPPSGGSRVLVTSRRREWDPTLGVAVLALDVLSRAESIDLLSWRLGESEDDDLLDAIAAELGDLPLALHLAGSYLARYRRTVSPTAYLEKLRSLAGPALLEHPSMQGRGSEHSPTGHERDVARTFALSYERLDPADPIDRTAAALLGRAACLAPAEPIPPRLLLATLQGKKYKKTTTEFWTTLRNIFHPKTKISEHEQEDALVRLRDLGLLAESEAGLSLHRLLAAFALATAPPGSREAVEETLLAEARRLNNEGYPAPLLAWQPHLRAVTETALPRQDKRAANLGNTLGYHLTMTADYARARSYYEQALIIVEKVFGPDHPQTAASLNNLGMLLHHMGDTQGARPYLEAI